MKKMKSASQRQLELELWQDSRYKHKAEASHKQYKRQREKKILREELETLDKKPVNLKEK